GRTRALGAGGAGVLVGAAHARRAPGLAGDGGRSARGRDWGGPVVDASVPSRAGVRGVGPAPTLLRRVPPGVEGPGLLRGAGPVAADQPGTGMAQPGPAGGRPGRRHMEGGTLAAAVPGGGSSLRAAVPDRSVRGGIRSRA